MLPELVLWFERFAGQWQDGGNRQILAWIPRSSRGLLRERESWNFCPSYHSPIKLTLGSLVSSLSSSEPIPLPALPYPISNRLHWIWLKKYTASTNTCPLTPTGIHLLPNIFSSHLMFSSQSNSFNSCPLSLMHWPPPTLSWQMISLPAVHIG